jgi:hypothetical protein
VLYFLYNLSLGEDKEEYPEELERESILGWKIEQANLVKGALEPKEN